MRILLIVLTVLLTGAGVFVYANKVSPVSWGWWGDVNNSGGLALGGYDPVAYHTGGESVEGDPAHTHDWKGATWRFTDSDNAARFRENPEKFAPEYGGFCSFAVSKGFTAKPAPGSWHIRDGKLYLFADDNVKERWLDNADESTKQSDANWSKR